MNIDELTIKYIDDAFTVFQPTGKVHNAPTSTKMSIFYSIISLLTHQNNTDNILNFAIRIIESEYQSPSFSIKKLSQECNMSESYFRRKFTDQYGVSPKKYLCDIRIAMAKRMLIEGLKNVSEISEQCGFASVYHFSRAFKLSVGETPKEFAKKQSL